MTDEQHFEDGLTMLKKMVGSAEADQIRQGWWDISPDLERLILELSPAESGRGPVSI